MTRRTLLTREQAERMDARLALMVEGDSDDRLTRDLEDADRLEAEDWHVSDEGRAMLVRRAVALGQHVGEGDVHDQFLRVLWGES